MSHVFRALAVLIGLVLAMPAAAQSCAAPGNLSALVSGLAQGVNAQRGAQGLGALRADPALMQAAQSHACDIARTGRVVHQGSDGRNSDQRVRAYGFRTCLTAENLAWGFPRPEQIVSGWMGSAGHRRNILLARATHYGAGVAQGSEGPMWVMVYAQQC